MAMAGATPAGAHGIGGHRSAVAGLAVGVGGWLRRCELLCGARRAWSQPRLVAAADGGRPLVDTRRPVIRGLEFITKSIGVFLFGVLMWAAWRGNPNGAVNIAGDALLIWFWVGLQLVSFLFGDVWRMFNPYVTIADSGAWVRAKIRGKEAAPTKAAGPLSLWPAVAAIFAYLWFELAYHSTDSPRSIAVFLTVYSVAMIGGAAVEGRGWVRRADGFAVLFTKLAAMSPIHRDDDGRVRLRSPLAGLSTLPDIPGTVPFILVVLGSTTFDGFTRSSVWLDIAGEQTGWGRTVSSTIGLLVITGLVAMAYSVAISAMANITGEESAELSRCSGRRSSRSRRPMPSPTTSASSCSPGSGCSSGSAIRPVAVGICSAPPITRSTGRSCRRPRSHGCRLLRLRSGTSQVSRRLTMSRSAVTTTDSPSGRSIRCWR